MGASCAGFGPDAAITAQAALAKPRRTAQILLTDLYAELFSAVTTSTKGAQEPIITAIAKNAAFPSLARPPAV
ncbi:MAG TPA: hypothetical protein VEX18_00250 [Polyangiaceae bacterium]|nr:hypothetical protein [Polyangiaceae bacterium]